MELVIKLFQLGCDFRIKGQLDMAIAHHSRALDIFHSSVGIDYDRPFWAKILLSRAEAYLLCGHYHMVEVDIKQALQHCPQQCFDTVSFLLSILGLMKLR